MARTFPPEAYQLAASYGLGTLVKLYKYTSTFIAYFIAIVILSGIPLLLGVIGLLISLITSLLPGSSSESSPLIGALLIAVLLSPVSAFFLFLSRSTFSVYVYECAEGFLVLERKTRQVTHALRWDEVRFALLLGGRGYRITSTRNEQFFIPFRGIGIKCRQALKQNQMRAAMRDTAQSTMTTPSFSRAEVRETIRKLLVHSENEAQVELLLDKLERDFTEASAMGQQFLAMLEKDTEAKQWLARFLEGLEKNSEITSFVEMLQVDFAEASSLVERFPANANEDEEVQALLERFQANFKEADRLAVWLLGNLAEEAETSGIDLAGLGEIRKLVQELLADLSELLSLSQSSLANLREWLRAHPDMQLNEVEFLRVFLTKIL